MCASEQWLRVISILILSLVHPEPDALGCVLCSGSWGPPKQQCSNHLLPPNSVPKALVRQTVPTPLKSSGSYDKRWKGQLLPYLIWALSKPSTLLSSSTSSSTANYTLDFQTNLPSPPGTLAPACAFPGSADPGQ